MAIVPYDVLLNNKKYLLAAGYLEYGLRETIRPGTSPGGDPTFRDNSEPEWAWWGQTKWMGEGVQDWKGDGSYYQGYGVDFYNEGQVSPAKKFVQGLSDATNPDGYMLFTMNTGAQHVAIGKTTGRAWTSPDKITWTDRGLSGGTSKLANAYAFFRGSLVLSMGDGTLRTSNDFGVTWIAFPTLVPPSANPAYVLGSYRAKLFISWGNDIYSWDGTTLSPKIVTLEGTPVTASVGSGVMYVCCQGNPARIYMLQGDQFNEMAQWPSEFQPDDSIFLDTLYVGGGGPDVSGGQFGEIWRLNNQGLELMYEFPIMHGTGWDYRIRSLGARDGLMLFSYNKGAGVGFYDPTLDTFADPVFGFGLGSRTPSVLTGTARVIGILDNQGATVVGIAGNGLYYESGYSDYQIISSLFGSTSERVSKLWNICEVTFSPFDVSQSIAVEFSKDGGTTWTALTSQTTFINGLTKAYYAFPAGTYASVLQYRLTVLCNSQVLNILNISFSFIEASLNPKRGWKFSLDLYGDADSPMTYNDGIAFERSSVAMKAELDALWNQRFPFQDIFGNTYTVMMIGPNIRVDDVKRTGDEADPTSVIGVVAQYSVSLVQV